MEQALTFEIISSGKLCSAISPNFYGACSIDMHRKDNRKDSFMLHAKYYVYVLLESILFGTELLLSRF
jgi:hypothetical protein